MHLYRANNPIYSHPFEFVQNIQIGKVDRPYLQHKTKIYISTILTDSWTRYGMVVLDRSYTKLYMKWRYDAKLINMLNISSNEIFMQSIKFFFLFILYFFSFIILASSWFIVKQHFFILFFSHFGFYILVCEFF